MKLASNIYWNVDYNEVDNIIETKWSRESVSLSAQNFQQHLIEFSQFVAMYKPKGFITNSQEGHYVIAPDLQTWHDNEIIPIYIQSGLRKIAFILPPNIFSAVSLEQTFEEKQAKLLLVKYFEDETKARNWINE